LQGSWKADFRDSLGVGTAALTLSSSDSQSLAGTYTTNLGGAGTVAVKPQGIGYKFILTQTGEGCTGSFVGELRLTDEKAMGTYSGTDCHGWHEEGTISMVRVSGDNAPAAEAESSGVVKEVPADAVIKQPARMPRVETKNQTLAAAADYPLVVRVLQTEQVPYSVQYGGAGTTTNCSINGSTYTTGSATSVGNYTFGNATSNTDLSMRCSSQENPPMRWRHILNTMLIVASNRNAYVIACDAAWRWSKCRALITGDTFRAKMASKGLAVEYYVNGKPKEATYTILQGKVLGY
jgi:hypothetical protein